MKKTTVFAIGAAAVCAVAVIALATCKKEYQEVKATNSSGTTTNFLRSVKDKGAKVVKKIKGEEEPLSEEELRARIEAARAKIAKRQQEIAAAGA